LSHRKEEFVLWPEPKNFTANSPCGQTSCHWLRWVGSPQYMLVDTSYNWDARYWLTSRDDFVDALYNLQKAHVIRRLKSWQTTTLYSVLVKSNN